MIKYSFLVPVYNVENYLGKCLESILNQTFDRNQFEIVLTDDGSTDESSSICDEYEQRYENVSVIHQANSGLLAARVNGIRNSRGEYLVFVDSDDYIEHDLLSIIDPYISEDSPDFLMYGYYRTYPDKKAPKYLTQEKCAFIDKETILKTFSGSNIYNGVAGKVVKRSVMADHLEEISGRRVNNGEDRVQTALLLKYSHKILLLRDCLYYYVIRRESISHKASYADIRDFIDSHLLSLKLYGEALELSELDPTQKRELTDEFCATALNGIMEQIYKYDNNDDISLEEKEKNLSALLDEKMYRFIRTETVSGIKKYNAFRLHLLEMTKYKKLIKLDWILMLIQRFLHLYS